MDFHTISGLGHTTGGKIWENCPFNILKWWISESFWETNMRHVWSVDFFNKGALMSIVKNLLRIEKMSIRFEDFSKFWETSPSSSLQTWLLGIPCVWDHRDTIEIKKPNRKECPGPPKKATKGEICFHEAETTSVFLTKNWAIICCTP